MEDLPIISNQTYEQTFLHNYSQNFQFFLMFALEVESSLLGIYKLVKSDEKYKIATFYLILGILFWFMLPSSKKIKFEISYSEDSNSKTLNSSIEQSFDRAKDLVFQKAHQNKDYDSEKLLNKILKKLNDIDKLEINFQTQVIESHKKIWELLELRRIQTTQQNNMKDVENLNEI
jgi:diacylglycerol kinase